MQLNPTAAKSWLQPSVAKDIADAILYLPIADKAVTEIPLQKLIITDDVVDLLAVNNPRLIHISIFNQQRESTYSGYSKVRDKLYQKLLIMLANLPKDLGIVYHEGFRSLAKQKEYFDHELKKILLIIKDKELAYQETTKFVSPFIDNIPPHCTGAAIDMSLFKINSNGKAELLDMGQFDEVEFGINNKHETFSDQITTLQRENRLLLLQLATQAGLVNYGYEWWHYSFGDKAWAYVKGEKYAIYDLVDQDSDILSIEKSSYLKQF